MHRLYAPQPVYLIDRFDRILPKIADGGLIPHVQEVRRRHVIDACQLLNKDRSFKYSEAHLGALAEALAFCRSKAAARLQLYRWLVFNVLIGNGDNHLKNISFLVGADGINVAPAYDMLSTAVYDTRALAGDGTKWPATELAFSLADATTVGGVRRAHLLAAGAMLGLAQRTATRELDTMLARLPREADKLLVALAAGEPGMLAACPDPDGARQHFAGEMRMLRALRLIVIAEMHAQLQ